MILHTRWRDNAFNLSGAGHGFPDGDGKMTSARYTWGDGQVHGDGAGGSAFHLRRADDGDGDSSFAAKVENCVSQMYLLAQVLNQGERDE